MMEYIGKQVKVTMEFGESVSGKVINQEGATLMVDTGSYDVRVFTDKDTIEVLTKEESKMKDNVDMPLDELKIYTGKETIEALLEGKVLHSNVSNCDYKFKDGDLLVDLGHGDGFEASTITAVNLITHKFTEVVTPQVGDWVRVTIMGKHTYVAQITSVVDDRMYAQWCKTDDGYFKFSDVDWEILSPEQVSEYKREQAFVKVGRKPDEYKRGDIVYIDSVYRVAIVASNNNTSVINLHGINEEGKGYTAKPHQLTPISFVEDQVSLD